MIKEINKDGYLLVCQDSGPDLGYSSDSGVRIIEKDGLAFKVHGGRSDLLPFEDWRLSPEERAADLASRLSLEEIAGLMLYSPQNRLPMIDDTYGGKPFAESGCEAWELSDGQKKFLLEDGVRHLLISVVESPETAARWNNLVQAAAEGMGYGIPANNSSDPRHSAFHDAEFAPGNSGKLSLWSHLLGLAATFSPETVREFGQIASAEYRALGLATALSPQADLGTDPRWYRYNSTFGNDPDLVTDLVRAYCEAFQSGNEAGEWGAESVNTMVKHWPGGGSGEGGRDAHYGNGKYAVYPGGCFEEHKKPFLQGAFCLGNPTRTASAVMPYYTISYNQTDENVGNSFNRTLITGQLREDAGYDGVVCTDWVITDDNADPGIHHAKPWGVEKLTVAGRHYKALMAGVDQFGGNNRSLPVIEAYRLGVKEHGEEFMRRRMEQSARRLLLNIFRPGLFENPYVDVERTVATVGCSEYMKAGYEQQLKSVVMLKNKGNILPLSSGLKVYVPKRCSPELINYWGFVEPERIYDPVPAEMARKYFDPVGDARSCDVAVVFVESPKSRGMGYDRQEVIEGRGNGYIPISLQYRPYKAETARKTSIAGDPEEKTADRNYRGKTAFAWNECDLDMVEKVRAEIGNKPLVVVMAMSNPAVMSEIEPLADAILVGFNVQTQACLDLIFGRAEPSALLPFEIPSSMEAVEAHCEDKPHDIEPYRDSEGNVYRFGYGLCWKGVISDWRTRKYAGS